MSNRTGRAHTWECSVTALGLTTLCIHSTLPSCNESVVVVVHTHKKKVSFFNFLFGVSQPRGRRLGDFFFFPSLKEGAWMMLFSSLWYHTQEGGGHTMGGGKEKKKKRDINAPCARAFTRKNHQKQHDGVARKQCVVVERMQQHLSWQRRHCQCVKKR